MHKLIDRGAEPNNSDIIGNKQTKKETMDDMKTKASDQQRIQVK